MANTKNLSREERKRAKRKARHDLKKLYQSLSPAERREFARLEVKVGLKKFLADKKREREKAEGQG